jgi:hypothetical protein
MTPQAPSLSAEQVKEALKLAHDYEVSPDEPGRASAQLLSRALLQLAVRNEKLKEQLVRAQSIALDTVKLYDKLEAQTAEYRLAFERIKNLDDGGGIMHLIATNALKSTAGTALLKRLEAAEKLRSALAESPIDFSKDWRVTAALSAYDQSTAKETSEGK